ncbi:hypothetical protein C1N55_18975 [Lysinibacillus sp. SGAir0095]|nr:hypothetical protein C1N55_18975 [Lysinibacillus sp. SGAir0095]
MADDYIILFLFLKNKFKNLKIGLVCPFFHKRSTAIVTNSLFDMDKSLILHQVFFTYRELFQSGIESPNLSI